MGLPQESGDCGVACIQLHERPLYFWLKSFAGREIEEDAAFSEYVTSNALTYALEYIGITSENEQSSLHLSAIFDEDSQQQSKNRYPTHYESETKSRIQSLNRVFIELKSYFEDHYSQIVAIRPPNSVHISSACGLCSVKEFEKLLFLILGAAIQGTQKQDTIRKIKRFPAKVQESLIECIKLIADNPELLNVKSWPEFQTLGEDEQRKIYESLLSLIRKLVLERNESIQNQLITDYFSGYMNCDQKRIYETRGYTAYSEFDKNTEDARLSSMRQLREQLHERSELLQECREELEDARNRVQELQSEVMDTQQKLRAMKKARDELDALREGQEKASRLESELHKMKSKLEETEHIYERVETLEMENRNLQLKHDMLLDQISFLSLEKTSSRDNSFDDYFPERRILTEGLDLDRTLKDDESFVSDDEEPSVKEKMVKVVQAITEELENLTRESDFPEKDDIIGRPNHLDISQTDFIDKLGENLVASTPKAVIEFKSQEVQTPTTSESRTKRRRRTSILNMKRTRRAIIIPIPGGQKLPISTIDKIAADGSPIKNKSSPTIHLYKVYNVDRRKGSVRPKKFKSPTKRVSEEKQVVPNVLDVGNEADEELSLSPTGVQHESDLDSNNENPNGTDNDSEIYFVCSPPNSTGTTTPRRGQFGTTTAFPISSPNGSGTPHTVNHDIDFDPQQNINSRHANHLTIYSRGSNPVSPTTVHVPLMKISHEVRIGGSEDTDEGLQNEDDPSNFSFADYNIQLNLRNTSIKPALINKITTLSANLNPEQYNEYQTSPRNNYLETSSEEDGSVWYEYGCV